MRLQEVQRHSTTISVQCHRCQQTVQVGQGHPPVWADLDGEPFKAYYCDQCSQEPDLSATKLDTPHAHITLYGEPLCQWLSMQAFIGDKSIPQQCGYPSIEAAEAAVRATGKSGLRAVAGPCPRRPE